jgi:hypothetical protein
MPAKSKSQQQAAGAALSAQEGEKKAEMKERAIATGENGTECVRFPSIMTETTLNV